MYTRHILLWYIIKQLLNYRNLKKVNNIVKNFIMEIEIYMYQSITSKIYSRYDNQIIINTFY